MSSYFYKLVRSRLVCVNKTDLSLTGCLKSDSTNGSPPETGYQKQWDHHGHLHWLQWTLLDPLEPLHAKVLKVCSLGNVSRNILESVSHLISVVRTQGPRSGSAQPCFRDVSVLGSLGTWARPTAHVYWLLLRTVNLILQVVVTLPALPLILGTELDLYKSYCASARVKIYEKRLYRAIE